MKKVLLVSFATIIVLCSSCKKEHTGCKPQNTPCPDGPRAVGMAVLPQGIQVGTYVFDVSMYYTYPGDDGTGKLEFWIGNKQYASQTPLQHADSANLGTSSFTIALAVDSFTITSVGYNTPQRCDCDPTVSNFHFETLPTSRSSKITEIEVHPGMKINAVSNITAINKRK